MSLQQNNFIPGLAVVMTYTCPVLADISKHGYISIYFKLSDSSPRGLSLWHGWLLSEEQYVDLIKILWDSV